MNLRILNTGLWLLLGLILVYFILQPLPQVDGQAVPVDTGPGVTTIGPIGDATADLLVARDGNAKSPPVQNAWSVFDNYTTLSVPAICGNQPSGTSPTRYTWLYDNVNSRFSLCKANTTLFTWPSAVADQTQALFGTTTSGVLQYKTPVLGTDTNGNYVASLAADSTASIKLTSCAAGEGPTCTVGVQGVGARVFNTSVQSIANFTVQALSFNTERRDDANFHCCASGCGGTCVGGQTDGMLKAPTAGWYTITCGVCTDQNATASARGQTIRWHDSGLTTVATIAQRTDAAPQSGLFGWVSNLATTYYLNAGEIVDCTVFQSIGSSLNSTPVPNTCDEFSIVYNGQ